MQDMNLSKQHREDLIVLCESLKTKSPEDAVSINNIIQFIRDQKYGLLFEKHQEQVDADLLTKIPIFAEEEDKRISLKIDADSVAKYNFLLEGDNLHSLKLLEKTHRGAIDVIYIDPPYNTGNEFVYNDKVVGIDDGYKHSKWLSFMSARLTVAYHLLSDSGIMFISIDDHEYANLKLLCDEIFGEECVETYIWDLRDLSEGSFPKTAKLTVRKEHEYILMCKKNRRTRFNKYLAKREYKGDSFSNPDNDSRGPWFSANISRNGITSTTGSKYFAITTPTGKVYERNWSISKEEYLKYKEEDLLYFGKDGNGVPRLKKFPGTLMENIQSSVFGDCHTSITGKKQLKDAIPDGGFDFPKPCDLIKRFCVIASHKNATVLDFFAGSGTTAQAVLELNKEDGGNRKFILCTNNENNICEEITYQRLKTVITGIRGDGSKYSDGIPANLKYFKAEMIELNDDDLDEKLLDASIPLIELENFEDIEGKNSSVFIAYSDEDLDEFEANFDKENNLVKTIYVAEDVCLSETQEQLFAFNDIKVKTIPNNFFREL